MMMYIPWHIHGPNDFKTFHSLDLKVCDGVIFSGATYSKSAVFDKHLYLHCHFSFGDYMTQPF